jgi:CheY-like chemotaxis protein
VEKFVLYADDDADDRAWIEENFKAVNAQLSLFFLENGRQVLEFLASRSSPQFPSLIIMDLNMPQLDGRQTLRQLKANPAYRHIPVAIVSTSSSRLDRETCYFLGAELFLVKPSSYHEWKTIMHQLLSLAG